MVASDARGIACGSCIERVGGLSTYESIAGCQGLIVESVFDSSLDVGAVGRGDEAGDSASHGVVADRAEKVGKLDL